MTEKRKNGRKSTGLELRIVAPHVQKMSNYVWNAEKSHAAILLAEGYTYKQVAAEIGKTEKTIYRWTLDMEFSVEVDRLSLMVGIASRAERLRLVKRVIRQKSLSDTFLISDKDILDWLKFAQSETDGVKLDIASLFTTVSTDGASMAHGGSARDRKTKTG